MTTKNTENTKEAGIKENKKSLIEQPYFIRFNALRAHFVSKKTVNKGVPFKSRSAEDILSNLNGLIRNFGLFFHVSTELVDQTNHRYIKATVTVFDALSTRPKDDFNLSFSAITEIPNKIMTMNTAQISGATLSYSTKYALGLALQLGDSDFDQRPQNQGR